MMLRDQWGDLYRARLTRAPLVLYSGKPDENGARASGLIAAEQLDEVECYGLEVVKATSRELLWLRRAGIKIPRRSSAKRNRRAA
jgi:hypothetical protein